MIVLDTNVLSEALRPAPAKRILNWLSAQDRSITFITVITQAEILYGLELLPAGKRKGQLQASISKLFEEEFEGKILSFDCAAAEAYSTIAAGRKVSGRPISQFDGMIAAIARVQGAKLASRNALDFVGCGIEIVDPWKD
jgi:toxin FitB